MKKYLFGALALPLLFACSSDELLEEKVVSNDQFAGIEKVDAAFVMDEETRTRFDGGVWNPEEGDLWGFAWMGDGTNVKIDGKAYQNHNLIQTNGIFTPQTSIYVGNYYIYRPYEKTVVSPENMKFNSLVEQPLADGYESAKQPWKDLAKTAINIGDKWTNVTKTGTTDPKTKITWDKAGIKEHYNIYAAVFSNQTGLDLTYQKNNVSFAADQAVKGASDIDFKIAAGTKVGAADIYEATIQLAGAANSFTYAPTAEPNKAKHDGGYWADKKNLGATEGFTFTTAPITLKNEDGVTTETENNKGWFWFNSLPVTAGTGALATNVDVTLTTSYGVVTILTKTLQDCAQVFDKPAASSTSPEWIKLAAADNLTKTPKEWSLASHNTFVNQYGNHKGKYALTADFSTGKMDGMHIKNDAQLQKVLKYYIAAGKSETGATLNLDGDNAKDKTFKISKISIALLQTINAKGIKVLVQPCTTHNNPVKIVITQDGQDAIGLANAKEVPALDNVFAASTDVYLSKDCEWTWTGDATSKTTPYKTPLTIDGNVKSLTNEGKLTVNATEVKLSIPGVEIKNAAGATMDITKVTTVHNPLTNLGIINVGSESNTSAELRAYSVKIKNDATKLDAYGVINNYGVVGVTDGTTPAGEFNNYGLINMMNGKAITLLSSNEDTSDFDDAFNAASNKMGTVVLPDNNPTAIVSVNNKAANGFIKYNWTGATYKAPAGNVKYNTIVVNSDITFTTAATEVQYIEFDGTRTQVVSPAGTLSGLKGIIVNAGKSIIIEKDNQVVCSNGAYLGAGATVYNGGTFTHNAKVKSGTTVTNYFGEWSTEQIVKY